MKKKRYRLGVLFDVLSGFLGGVLLSHFIVTGAVFAKKAVSHEKVLAAEEFRLVNHSGMPRVCLKVDTNGEFSVSLYDKEGRPTGTFGLGAEGRPSLTFGAKPQGDEGD
jgi:hypothetical protein